MIRPYAAGDREAVLALHAQYGPNQFLADPDDERQVFPLVLERDGNLFAYGVGRRTLETFCYVDRTTGSPQDRWNAVNALLDAGVERLNGDGIGEIHLATEWPAFARRLARLPGMIYDPRIHFVRVLAGGGYGS